MLRSIPAAASFTFETHDNFLDALELIANLDRVRVLDPAWMYAHSKDAVETFSRSPKQTHARDCARKYAAAALSIHHLVEHK